MKIVKKSLIITSALALGLLVAGCGKKSVVINDRNAYKMSELSKYDKYDTFKSNVLNVRVKSHQVLSNRIVWYVTTNDETIIYDYMSNKVLYSTFDKVKSIAEYVDHNILMIKFNDSDNSRMLIATNGTVLAEKDKYYDIGPSVISNKENKKKDNYSERIFYVLTKKTGSSSVVKYYKLVKAGVKNYRGKLIEDLSLNYTLTEISEDEARKYKKGDSYPTSDEKYMYECYDDTSNKLLRFYDESTSKTILTMKYNGGSRKVIVLKDKAIVQFYSETTANDNYDVCFNDTYLNVETYLVDLKNASYKKIDNFKYYLGYADYSTIETSDDAEYAKYYTIENAGLIEKKTISKIVDIAIDNNAKVVQDDQKLVYYDTYYYDLGNGNYVVEENGTTYLTDKNGSIKKVFDGHSRVLYDSKVIVLYDSYSYYEVKLIDFKGNYIGNTIKSAGATIASDKEIFYKDKNDNSKLHLLKIDNASIVSDEIVDYAISTSTSISSLTNVKSEKDRYYNTYHYYFTAKPVDKDNDEVTDYIDVTYYTIDGVELGKVSNVNRIDIRSTYAFDGKSNYASFATIDKTATDYTLQIDLIAKD
ncbi:MAG: hypothetical protein K6E87_02290 [bacterium]|nr:hypothetical protein [bacterium]